jgi:hypothetical protein
MLRLKECRSVAAIIPVVLIVLLLAVTTLRHSRRWTRMAEPNTAILSQMKAEQLAVGSNARIVLRYMPADRVDRFPDSSQDWTFPSAVQLLYANPTLYSVIVNEPEPAPVTNPASTIYFTYVADAETPTIRKTMV